MKRKTCTASCPHLRGICYGYDGSTILAAYNGKDKLAQCAKRPGVSIAVRAQMTCFFDRED